jgi:hypothetical protein
LNLENPIIGVEKTRRVPLIDKDGNAVQTITQAVAELKRLQTKRADNTLPTLTRTPKFADYAARYLEFVGSGNGAKKPALSKREKPFLTAGLNFLGTWALIKSNLFMSIASLNPASRRECRRSSQWLSRQTRIRASVRPAHNRQGCNARIPSMVSYRWCGDTTRFDFLWEFRCFHARIVWKVNSEFKTLDSIVFYW